MHKILKLWDNSLSQRQHQALRSVSYTWTIYANAFRVTDKIRQQL